MGICSSSGGGAVARRGDPSVAVLDGRRGLEQVMFEEARGAAGGSSLSLEELKKARRVAEFRYFSSSLPYTKRATGCALDTATALQSPLRSAMACHLRLPSLDLSAAKAPRPSSWIGMK